MRLLSNLEMKQLSLNSKSFEMKKNMGNFDRVIRLVLAGVIALLYFSGTITGVMAIVLMVLGGIFVLTSAISFCPLYLPFGLSTCKKES
jgi:fatty acid desaturase